MKHIVNECAKFNGNLKKELDEAGGLSSQLLDLEKEIESCEDANAKEELKEKKVKVEKDIEECNGRIGRIVEETDPALYDGHFTEDFYVSLLGKYKESFDRITKLRITLPWRDMYATTAYRMGQELLSVVNCIKGRSEYKSQAQEKVGLLEIYLECLRGFRESLKGLPEELKTCADNFWETLGVMDEEALEPSN